MLLLIIIAFVLWYMCTHTPEDLFGPGYRKDQDLYDWSDPKTSVKTKSSSRSRSSASPKSSSRSRSGASPKTSSRSRSSATSRRIPDDFDYERAMLDVLDNGGDPDYIDTKNVEKRNRRLKELRLDPEEYQRR